MAFFNEFPHTRTYDSDLAWLIERMKDLYTRFEQLDNIVNEINQLMDDIRQMMSELETRVEEITRRVTSEEVGKYLPQNARPIAGYANENDTKSRIPYSSSNGWSVVQNFAEGGFRVNTSGSAYLVAYETYDRYLFIWDFPCSKGTTGLSSGVCRLTLNGTYRNQFNSDFNIDYTESPAIYGNINAQRYITGQRLTKSSTDEGLGDIYPAHQVYPASSTATIAHLFTMSVKKKTPGWTS